jgi:hypothetical protein
MFISERPFFDLPILSVIFLAPKQIVITITYNVSKGYIYLSNRLTYNVSKKYIYFSNVNTYNVSKLI